jgi:hypothetical protein
MNRYLKWKSVLVGGVAFVASHYVEAARWQTWFGGEHAPWFLNDGNRAVLFTMTCLFGAALVAGLLWARDAPDAVVEGANVAGGAAIAMAILLFMAPGGPGTLFPIAIAIGLVTLVVSTGIASALVAMFKRRAASSR